MATAVTMRLEDALREWAAILDLNMVRDPRDVRRYALIWPDGTREIYRATLDGVGRYLDRHGLRIAVANIIKLGPPWNSEWMRGMHTKVCAHSRRRITRTWRPTRGPDID